MAGETYSEYWLRRNDNKMDDDDKKYLDWMDDVEYEVISNTSLYLLDLPDELYRDSFDFGISAHNMAMTVLQHLNEY